MRYKREEHSLVKTRRFHYMTTVIDEPDFCGWMPGKRFRSSGLDHLKVARSMELFAK